MRKKIITDLIYAVWGAAVLASPVYVGMHNVIQTEQIQESAALPELEVNVSVFEIAEPIKVQQVEAPAYTKLEEIPLIVQDNAYELSQTYHIAQEFLEAIAFRESTFKQDAVSADGSCIGTMQVNPRWHEERMERLGITAEELTQVDCNMLVAADYLSELFEEYEDPAVVLMIYNGDSRAESFSNGKGNASNYAQDILDLAQEYEQKRGKLDY